MYPNPDYINSDPINTTVYEGTCIFYVSLFQYVTTCVAFSISKPFRQPIYSNLLFTITILILLVLNILITITSPQWLLDVLTLEKTTLDFQLSILLIAFVNGVVTFLFEKIAIWYLAIWWRNRKERQRNKEFQIENEEAVIRAT